MKYKQHYENLKSIFSKNEYDNILFCCGPTGKVLLSQLFNVCDSNMVDLGCLINAIIDGALGKDGGTVRRWNMNWVDNFSLPKITGNFFNQLQKINP